MSDDQDRERHASLAQRAHRAETSLYDLTVKYRHLEADRNRLLAALQALRAQWSARDEPVEGDGSAPGHDVSE